MVRIKVFSPGPDTGPRGSEMLPSACTSALRASAQHETLRHHSDLTIKGIHSASCTHFGKNMPFSELFNQGSNGKGFPLYSKLTDRPHHLEVPYIPDHQFLLWKKFREEFKDQLSAFCKKKWLQKLTQWRPFSSTKFYSTASFTGGPERAGGSRQ